MVRKKIVFIIVEGPSDDDALGVIFSNILNKDDVHMHIVHGDITTRNGITSNNILAKICDMVKEYAGDIFKASDFKEIVHIVDTDGAYISDEYIHENKELEKTQYGTKNITAKSKMNIIKRNQQKRSVLDKMINSHKVWKNIPYSCYYMSCNLDHVLHDKMNSTDKEKENDAFNFAKKYKQNTDDFISFIYESDFSVVNGYKESWEYIKKEKHSLERNTNLGIFFKINESIFDSE